MNNSSAVIMLAMVLIAGAFPQAASGQEPYVRRIMPGDRLRIAVQEQTELNRVYAVAGDGTIDIGVLGRISLADMTAPEAADFIEARLLDGYFRQATVQVEVADYVEGSLLIIGAVGSPGEIPFRGDDILTLAEAIARRGGLARNAAGTEVRILRWKPGGSMERQVIVVDVQSMFEDLDFSNDQYLRPRDMVIVPSLGGGADRQNEFLVLGEFGSPGFHPYTKDMDLIRAVTRAGGVSREGRLQAARLLRADEDGVYQAIPIDLSLLFGAADMSQNIPIRPGDILFVPSAQQALRGQVYLLGEVNRRGAFPLPMETEATLAKLLLSAGGTTKFANESRVRIMRDAPDGSKQTLIVNVGRILKHGTFEEDVPVMDGDIIIVPEAIINF